MIISLKAIKDIRITTYDPERHYFFISLMMDILVPIKSLESSFLIRGNTIGCQLSSDQEVSSL